MTIIQCMYKTRIWRGRVVCLIVASLFCIAGHEVDASISTQDYTQQELPIVFDAMPSYSDKLDWIVAKRKKGHGNLSPEQKNRVHEWNKMPPEEQQRYRERYQRWKQMSPEERKRYEQWHQQWEQLSPDERQKIRKKLKRWDKLSPRERETIRRWFKK